MGRWAGAGCLKLTLSLELTPDRHVVHDLPTAAAVITHVLASSWYQNANAVSIYLSTPVGEITTDSLVRDAFAKGEFRFRTCSA